MRGTWTVGLAVVMGTAAVWGGTARGQGAQPADDAPAVYVNGQPVGQTIAPALAPEGVTVQITADSPSVRLMRVDGDRQTVICGPPCGAIVPRNGTYQLGGDGVVRTGRFTVPADRPDLHLFVESGSNTPRVAGIVVAIAGYATVLAGNAYLSYEGKGSIQSASTHAKEVGGALIGSGLLVGTVGLVLILTSKTRVATSTGATFSQASPSGRRTAFRLTPAGLEF